MCARVALLHLDAILKPETYHRDVARHSFKFPLFSFDHLDYCGLIGHYRRLFGSDQIFIYAYELFRSDPIAFSRGFALDLGLSLADRQIDYTPVNRSLARNALCLARLLNHFTYRSVLDKRVYISLLSNKFRSDLPLLVNRTALAGPYQPPKQLLGRHLVERIYRRFAEPNRRLATEIDLPLRELGYPWPDQ